MFNTVRCTLFKPKDQLKYTQHPAVYKINPSYWNILLVFNGILFAHAGTCSAVPWVPSRHVYTTESSTLQEYWHEACKQNSGFSMVLWWSCLALLLIRYSYSRFHIMLIQFCHLWLSSPCSQLSGSVIPMPVTPDETMVNHQKGCFFLHQDRWEALCSHGFSIG